MLAILHKRKNVVEILPLFDIALKVSIVPVQYWVKTGLKS